MKCYICRKHLTAEHSHFRRYGILAAQAPRRSESDVRAEWLRLSATEQANALAAVGVTLDTKTPAPVETAATVATVAAPAKTPRTATTRARHRVEREDDTPSYAADYGDYSDAGAVSTGASWRRVLSPGVLIGAGLVALVLAFVMYGAWSAPRRAARTVATGATGATGATDAAQPVPIDLSSVPEPGAE